jgi:hypothetical protein
MLFKMSEEKVSAIKAWLTPILMSILGVMIWHDLNEMKRDIKTLLAKDSANQIRIDQLEKDIDIIKKQIYLGMTSYNKYMKREEEPKIQKEDND